MPASSKKGRDNSGHSGHPNKYRVFERPDSMSRVFRTRDRKWLRTRAAGSKLRCRMAGDSALDCGVATKRPMSRTGRTLAA